MSKLFICGAKKGRKCRGAFLSNGELEFHCQAHEEVTSCSGDKCDLFYPEVKVQGCRCVPCEIQEKIIN